MAWWFCGSRAPLDRQFPSGWPLPPVSPTAMPINGCRARFCSSKLRGEWSSAGSRFRLAPRASSPRLWFAFSTGLGMLCILKPTPRPQSFPRQATCCFAESLNAVSTYRSPYLRDTTVVVGDFAAGCSNAKWVRTSKGSPVVGPHSHLLLTRQPRAQSCAPGGLQVVGGPCRANAGRSN